MHCSPKSTFMAEHSESDAGMHPDAFKVHPDAHMNQDSWLIGSIIEINFWFWIEKSKFS